MKLGWVFAQYQFIDIWVLGIVLFFLFFYLVQLRMRNMVHGEEAKEHRYYDITIENLVFVVMMNNLVVNVLDIIINHHFFFWLDFLVIPLARMAFSQLLLVHVILVYLFSKRNSSLDRRIIRVVVHGLLSLLEGGVITLIIILMRVRFSFVISAVFVCVVALSLIGLFYIARRVNTYREVVSYRNGTGKSYVQGSE